MRTECEKLGLPVVLLDEEGSTAMAEQQQTMPTPRSDCLLACCSSFVTRHRNSPRVGSRASCSCFGRRGELKLAYAMFTSGTTGKLGPYPPPKKTRL